MTSTESTENLLRELAPQVLGALVRRYGDFADCEDAVQEALIAAAADWPREGQPDNPLGWLIRVASRRLANLYRGDIARPESAGEGTVGRDHGVAEIALSRVIAM